MKLPTSLAYRRCGDLQSAGSRTNTVITTPLGQGEEDLSITRLPWADFSARFAEREQASGAAKRLGSLCHSPAAAASRRHGTLRLVEDDTAALRSSAASPQNKH